MDFSKEHYQYQEDVISDALQELLCSEKSCDQAYDAIVNAIDSWLNYHQAELDKWLSLKKRMGQMSESKRDNWLDSPELQELRKAWHAFEQQQSAEDQAWWDSLDYEAKGQAFRQICKLMHQAEVKDKGSYRWAMYDVFGLDYGDGLSHYMDLHNLISQGLDLQQNFANRKGDMAKCDISKDNQ